MKDIFVYLLLGLAAVALGVGIMTDFGCTKLCFDGGKTESVSYLFSQDAQSGTLSQESSGTYLLTLQEVSDFTVVFTDRPIRDAFTTGTADFVEQFGEAFGDDPPNAALSFETAGAAIPRTAVFTVDDPAYDSESRTLTYRATDIRVAGDGLSRLPSEFDTPSLFIDASDWPPGAGLGPVLTWSLTVTVQDANGNPVEGVVIGTEGKSGTSDSQGTVNLFGALGTLPSSVTATKDGTDVLSSIGEFDWSGDKPTNDGAVTVVVNTGT